MSAPQTIMEAKPMMTKANATEDVRHTERNMLASRLVVKWQTPTDEALGCARIAGALVERRIAQPSQLALVAPNRLWAQNLKSACDSCGVSASLCISQPQFARALSHSIQAAPANLKGFSLIRHLGWAHDPKMEHALLHVAGTEDADVLYALVRQQLLAPTVSPNTTHIPIVLASSTPSSSALPSSTPSSSALPNARYIFIVGCVKGLFGAGEDEQATRVQFARLVASGTMCTLASYFVKAPLELAEAAHIPYGRQKMEDGKRIAFVQPSPLLEEAGIWRPTTTGGQALLRSCGLN